MISTSRPTEGRSRSSRTRGGMRWTRQRQARKQAGGLRLVFKGRCDLPAEARTNHAVADGPSCMVLARRPAPSTYGGASIGHRGSCKASRQLHCVRECRGSRRARGDHARVLVFTLRTRLRVCRTPGVPARPLFCRGAGNSSAGNRASPKPGQPHLGLARAARSRCLVLPRTTPPFHIAKTACYTRA